MDFGIIVVIVLLLVTIFLIVIAISKMGKKDDNRGQELLLQQLNELNRTVDTKIGESNKMMTESVSDQFSKSQKLIQDVTEKLTRLDETNKQVISFTDQLRSLQDILKNPKQRGVLGEYYLETLLKNVLPVDSYKMQYKIGVDEQTKSDLIVDAAVFVKDKVIPIDSKFSLENYNRISETNDPAEKARLEKVFLNDLKLRIRETSKYIKPEKDTMDFAFMFIPHEAIYYDLLVNKIGSQSEAENIIQVAAGKYHVIIVSPTSFLAYLQTVLQGLKALQIEQDAKEIKKHVADLQRHLKNYSNYHGKLGNTIKTVVNHYDKTSHELIQLSKDTNRITDGTLSIKTPELEAPILEE